MLGSHFQSNPTNAKLQFETDGFFIEPDVLTDEDCESLITSAHQLADSEQLPPLMMPHRNSDVFLKQLKHEKIVKIMRYFLSGDISGLQSQFFFSKPGAKGFAVHQDNFFVEAKNNQFASVWCPLVDVSKKNGCLFIYPETNNAGLLPVKQINVAIDDGQDKNAANEECVIPPKYKCVNVEMKRGSALFIHGLLAHGSHENQSQDCRYVSLNTYIRRGEKFRAGETAKRAEVEI